VARRSGKDTLGTEHLAFSRSYLWWFSFDPTLVSTAKCQVPAAKCLIQEGPIGTTVHH